MYSVLYKISLESSKLSSYLFGTVHAMPAEVRPWLSKALEYLPSCHYYFGETDLEEMSSFRPEHVQDFDLRDYISESKYRRKRKFAYKAFDLDLERYRFMHPFWLQAYLLTRIWDTGSGSMDQILWQNATEMGLHKGGVESFEYQKEILNRMDISALVKQVMKLLDNPAKEKRKMTRLIDLYANGDIQAIYKTTRSGLGQMRRMMIHERNDRMTTRIFELLHGGPSFISIGVAHLGGALGVLRGLKQKGVNIQPISLSMSL